MEVVPSCGLPTEGKRGRRYGIKYVAGRMEKKRILLYSPLEPTSSGTHKHNDEIFVM